MAKKTERLLALMDVLRSYRRPVTGRILAERLGVSLRTVYRDIDGLRALGMPVDGEAGLGYQLRGDTFLPPLTLGHDELEALTLGLRGQIHGPDEDLRDAARIVLSKIAAVLPADRRDALEALGLFSLPQPVRTDPSLRLIRSALRDERQISLRYRDRSGADTRRVIWPVAMGYLTDRQDLIAFCTLRQDFRRFVTDRMTEVTLTDDPLPQPRRDLLFRWRQMNGLPDLT